MLPRSRPVVAGREAAVACAHPLAAQVGLRILGEGGNAMDAAIAMAVALGVVEPYMSGVGGVGFLLVSKPGAAPRVLNFGGHAPADAAADGLTEATREIGPRAVLVPGNVAGWFEAHQGLGRLSWKHVWTPAIELAQRGFPLHPFNVQVLHDWGERLDATGRAIYQAVPWRIGAILRLEELADTLALIAEHGPDIFYRGPLADKIVATVRQGGGWLSQADLASYRPEWQEPVEVEYRGFRVATCPPNNEGFQILQTLKLLEGFDLRQLGHNSAAYIHLVSEAVKLATADRIQWCGDPRFQPVPTDRLLSEVYVAERQQTIDSAAASCSGGERWRPARYPKPVQPGRVEGLTTHLAVVDGEGTVVTLTQSIGNPFGSGVTVPGTGIVLNNFAWWFEIDSACPTPNVFAPGKRWSACMAPVQVFHLDGSFWFSMGTPGSYGILHTTVQMLLNVIEFGADIQAAIEAPRFRLYEGTRMSIETRVPLETLADLSRKGHQLELLGDWSWMVGGGQSVMIDPVSHARLGGADPRRDSYAVAW